MKKNNNDVRNSNLRQQEHDAIESQIQEFLDNGGQIEVVASPFDNVTDPKCRLGEDMGLFS